jgi:RNA-directed DNA polymerase
MAANRFGSYTRRTSARRVSLALDGARRCPRVGGQNATSTCPGQQDAPANHSNAQPTTDSNHQLAPVRDLHAHRLAQCRLQLHPDKTRIVHCKDANRRATYANERFDFLGYAFRPRSPKRRAATYAVNFLPAVSNNAIKAMGQKLRSWRINRRSDKSLDDLADFCNRVVQGWINYHGRFYRSELVPLLRRINTYLVRWAKRKYKRLRGQTKRAQRCLVRVARRQPTLFAHMRPTLREPEGETPSGHSPSLVSQRKLVSYHCETRS